MNWTYKEITRDTDRFKSWRVFQEHNPTERYYDLNSQEQAISLCDVLNELTEYSWIMWNKTCN